MADQKISALTAATTPLAGTEVLPIVQSSTTVKVSVDNLTNGRAVSAASLALTGSASATSVATGLGLVGTPAYAFTGDLNTGLWSPAADTVAVSTAGVERLRVTNAGNLGLGSITPTPTFGSRVLQVEGTADDKSELRLVHTTSGVGATDGFSLLLSASDAYVYNRENGPIIFGTNNAVRMQITAAGDVGIGTAAPNARFAVIPAVNPATATGTLQTAIGEATNNAIYQMRMGYTSSYQGVINVFAGGVGSELVLNPSGGKVGIGLDTISYQLQLSTDSAAKPSTNTWTIVSDSRIKTETGEYTKGLDAVCALRPITYQYNGAAGFAVDGKENISIIAQEAMQHFPECVGTFEALLNKSDEEKTELYNWNGHALTFALVNAVKELKASNDALAARVNQLEGK
tara:strand:+ start:882 stop:2087 length:1206 start_codon:yes stop_codon:yes gene_type:complete